MLTVLVEREVELSELASSNNNISITTNNFIIQHLYSTIESKDAEAFGGARLRRIK